MRFLNLCFTLLLPLALAFTTLSGCEKDDGPKYGYPPKIDYNVLPPETQEGLNTFGCKVNGKVWVARVLPVGIIIRDIEALVSESSGSGGSLISAYMVDPAIDAHEYIEIVVTPTYFNTGDFCFDNTNVFFKYDRKNFNAVTSDYFQFSNDCVTITKFDTENNIISGTFACTLVPDSTKLNNKIEITEGRFDLKYEAD